jgi:2-phospho-L-lactate guanylyltransferase
VVVPIRAFDLGMARLASVLTVAQRVRLGRHLAELVIRAAQPAPVVVVTADADVGAWASSQGAAVLDDPGRGLDAAADAGRAHLAAAGCTRVVVSHADLARIVSFDAVIRDAGQPVACIVPCHHDDGTPVLSIPIGVPFAFSYGPGSFRRHVAEAARHGLGVRVVREPTLAFDVDTPADLARIPAAWTASTQDARCPV